MLGVRGWRGRVTDRGILKVKNAGSYAAKDRKKRLRARV